MKVKKFLAACAATFLFIACATLNIGNTCNLDAEYYVTSPSGQTSSWCPDEELAIVENVDKENQNPDVKITFVWVDYTSYAVALEYHNVTDDRKACGIFFFYEEDINTAIGDNYREVQPYQVMEVDCEKMRKVAMDESKNNSI